MMLGRSSLRLRSSALLLLHARTISAGDTATFSEATAFTQNPLPSLRHDSILSTIGGTPVVKLNRLSPPGVDVFVKAEAFNPMGSVNDRLALGVSCYFFQGNLVRSRRPRNPRALH